ncbi:hypothetical protein [Estrella lausannensis]|uniref:Uncharacterized protein n=1 Tax=Estrella lausannensis TaxID=483423 RepID=A0A0H5DR93_9BACT|nr:hypothetical protein [Estrella lausannensis]CRX38693.1 hypothetical protein ELAC_1355 [Estrella lausannensis]
MIGFTFLLFLNFFSQEPVYETMSKEIIKKYSKEVLKPNDLPIYVMGGSSDKGINSITLGVNKKGPGTIKEGRRLIVNLVSELIARYNNSEQIRPYLLNYPFDENNFVFKVSYINPQGGFWIKQVDRKNDEQIALIGLYYGTIQYCIHTGDEIAPLQKVHQETFENAVRIVKEDDERIKNN